MDDRDPNQVFVPRWVILLLLCPLYIAVTFLVIYTIRHLQ